MGAPRNTVCEPWATQADLCSPCDDYDIPGALLDDMLAVASDILYRLSGRQYPGTCSLTIRPCIQSSSLDSFPDRTVDFVAYAWPGACGCSRPRACGCTRLPELDLGRVPVTDITAVKVDGVTLTEGVNYRLDDYRYLVRIDGEGWGCCQDLTLPDTEPDTFSVAFSYGLDPPPSGVLAAAVLGCELALSCSPESLSSHCRLPRNIQSLSRQGVSIVLNDPTQLLVNHRTGIFEIDAFLQAVNPHRLQRRATVISPDIMARARQIGT